MGHTHPIRVRLKLYKSHKNWKSETNIFHMEQRGTNLFNMKRLGTNDQKR